MRHAKVPSRDPPLVGAPQQDGTFASEVAAASDLVLVRWAAQEQAPEAYAPATRRSLS
jgi:hypothetical protein